MKSILFCFITKEEPALAKAELDYLLDCNAIPVFPGVLRIETDKSLDTILLLCNRLAMTLSIGLLHKTIKGTSLKNIKSNTPYSFIQNTYKISLSSLSPLSFTLKQLADVIFTSLSSPMVSMTTYDHEYKYFVGKKETYFLEMLFQQTDKPGHRRSHLKSYNHPTSIHPKFAKVMINLAGTAEFIDPFCGAGGLVIEGGLMGVSAKGSDISSFLVKRAKENARSFDVDVSFAVCDALLLKEKTPAIITDLPYGRNSLSTKPLFELYEDFFVHAQELTSIMVICVADTTPLDELLKKTFWNIAFSHTFYVHKSLSRRIVVLHKQVGGIKV